MRIARGHELFVNLACSYYAMHSVAISEIFYGPTPYSEPSTCLSKSCCQ